MTKTIKVTEEFSDRLTNRNQLQGDGKKNAEDFRKKYLSFLDSPDEWVKTAIEENSPAIIFDFSEVKKIGPSFANEAFAYFTKYEGATPKAIMLRISFINISIVQKEIIEIELESGYSGYSK